MPGFREAVTDLIAQGMKQYTFPVQGYIPGDKDAQGNPVGIDKKANTCTVRIPNPHGGIHPSSLPNEPRYIELKSVPLPFYYKGFIGGVLNLLKGGGDRGVLVGFKGGNMAYPYIISPLSILHEHTDDKDKSVPNRTPVTPHRFRYVAGSHRMVAPNVNVDPPTTPTFRDINQGNTGPVQKIVAGDAPKLSTYTTLQNRAKEQITNALTKTLTTKISKK